jgi:hypothetical protein
MPERSFGQDCRVWENSVASFEEKDEGKFKILYEKQAATFKNGMSPDSFEL